MPVFQILPSRNPTFFMPAISLLLFCLAPLACGMGSSARPAAPAMSIQALIKFCGLPRPCSRPVTWQGQLIHVQGYLDPVNVFDKKRYPQLPYEKFKLIDRQGRSVEVFARGTDTGAIFAKLAGLPANTLVIVAGRLEAVQLPAKTQCNLGVKVWINDASQLELQQR